MSDVTDPRGFLKVFPPLKGLLPIPEVDSAVRSGDPFALAAALRRYRKTDPQATWIDEALATRRFFLRPVQRAPSLSTLNGIGSRLYGKAEVNPADGSYITTLFFTILYFPIWPIRQYLVRANGGRSYSFFAEAPLSKLMRAWRAAVMALIGLGAVGSGAAVLQGSHHQDVYVLNGLDTAVTVRFDGQPPVTVPSEGRRLVDLRPGPHAVTALGPKGETLESLSLQVPSFTDVVAYNVLGAAPAYLESAIYTEHDRGLRPPPARLYCGQSTIVADGVYALFRDLPQETSVDAGSSKTLTRFDIAQGGWGTSIDLLMHRHRTADAAALASRLALAQPGKVGLAALAWDLTRLLGPTAKTRQWMESWKAKAPKSSPVTRFLASYLAGDGRTEEAVALAKTVPDPVDAFLLEQRFHPIDEMLPQATALLEKHPDSGALAILIPDLLTSAGKFEKAAAVYGVLEQQGMKIPDWHLRSYARALTAAGKVDQAESELAAAAAAKDAEVSIRLDWLRLVALREEAGQRGKAFDAALKKLPGVRDDAPMLRAAVLGELDPSAKPGSRALEKASFLRELERDPTTALRQLAQIGDDSLTELPSESLLLLGAEAVRRHQDRDAQRLFAALMDPALDPGAVTRFVREGTDAPGLERLWPEDRAALGFVRARVLGPTSREGRALLEQATRLDVLHTAVGRAIHAWAPPS